jgi:purine-cytosine permease-like protein
MVAGVGTPAAGGISWAPTAPDFTRHLPRTASGRSVVIGALVPDWISVPYLLTAVVGMVLINAMSMYSAGFTAQTLGFVFPRTWRSARMPRSVSFRGVC